MTFLAVAREIYEQEHWKALGYTSPEEYFDRRLGMSWRTLQKRLAIVDAVKRLPPSQQDEASIALSEIGVEKAAIIAPVIGVPGHRWKNWIERAKQISVEELQAEVSAALGTGRDKTEGDGRVSHAADEKWFRHTDHVLRSFSPELADEFVQVMGAGKVIVGAPEHAGDVAAALSAEIDTKSYFGVLAFLIAEAKVEWLGQAAEIARLAGAGDTKKITVPCTKCGEPVEVEVSKASPHGDGDTLAIPVYHAECAPPTLERETDAPAPEVPEAE